MAQIKANFGKQKPLNDDVKKMADTVQFRQEMGGLTGRILLAVLLIAGMSRVKLLKIGVQVRVTIRKLWLALSESCPWQATFAAAFDP